MNAARIQQLSAGVYDPALDENAFTVRDLLTRDDADETFARIARVIPPDSPDPELVVTLTALAVLRGRAAAEKKGARL